MRSPRSLSDIFEMLEEARKLAHSSSCVEIIRRCNDLIEKSVKIALKKVGRDVKGPYSLDQLKKAGLPSWYLEAVYDACSEAGILPFCTVILDVPESREGCTNLDIGKALNATEKVVMVTKKLLEM